MPEIVPIGRKKEIERPAISDIEGALGILKREEERGRVDEVKKPTMH